MSTSYPTALPRPQRDGYSITAAAAAVGTARERAAERCRRIGRGSRSAVALVWHFTPAQFAVFAGWWRYDLDQGSLPALIVLPNGTADTAQPVRFLGAYTAEDLDGRWRVTVAAELLAPPRISADDIAGLITHGSLSLPVADLHTLVHTSIPARILP